MRQGLGRLEDGNGHLGPVLRGIPVDADEPRHLGDHAEHLLEGALVLRLVDVCPCPDLEEHDLHLSMVLLDRHECRQTAHDGQTMGVMETVPMTEVPRTVLRRYYDELMAPAFPPAELMTWDELDAALDAPGTHGWLVREDGQPVAGLVTEDYVDAALLLVAYVVVSARHRGQGVGSALLRRALGHEERPVLGEIEDPRFHVADDLRGDPAARVRFYERLGGRLLPIPYAQPSLRPGSPRVDNLLLITMPSAGTDTELDGGLVRAFLDEYYDVCEGPDVVANDPAYRSLRDHVPDVVPLVGLSELHLARPGPPS